MTATRTLDPCPTPTMRAAGRVTQSAAAVMGPSTQIATHPPRRYLLPQLPGQPSSILLHHPDEFLGVALGVSRRRHIVNRDSLLESTPNQMALTIVISGQSSDWIPDSLGAGWVQLGTATSSSRKPRERRQTQFASGSVDIISFDL